MMTPSLQDYIRLGITVVFLGLFSYQVVTGNPIDPFIRDNLVMLLGFYFAADRIGDFAGKFITLKKAQAKKKER